ncbi:MAG: response regulator transcription factor [Nitrospirae bacterium]|nr:response regulator transcription factor [Nitrospirota bacterium]MBI3595071.1 response regulator transcription factor [Nitrospirota bacterium]
MIRVFLADDHPIVREGLKTILSKSKDIVLVGEADNGVDVVKKARQEKWDVLVLDLSLPGRSGLNVLKEIQTFNPRLPILILSVHSETQYAQRVLKAGAAGYLTKECVPEKLVQAIRTIHGGERYVSEAMGAHFSFLLEGGKTHKEPHEHLSDREFEVFMMIAQGKSNSEIAELLHVSVKTVSSHRANILGKMDLSSVVDIALYAVKAGLISQ